MEFQRIKELLFLAATNHPFPSSELYLFFGFSRHNNFVRIVKKDKYKADVMISQWKKVRLRRNNVYYITRDLFYTFCQKFLKDYSYITEMYLEQKRSVLRSKILKFGYNANEKYIFGLNINVKLKGHYYTYSLNTLNLSSDLNIDVYDLFKFCSLEFCSKVGYSAARCTNELGIDKKAAYPYYSFDNVIHERRYVFVELLKTILKTYKLSDFQKQVIDVYSGLIKQMLEKQLDYDIKEHRRTTTIITLKFIPPLTKEQETEMKFIYRKAALLCHPDKNAISEDTFKDLNNANKNKDLQKVKDIYSRLR